MWQELKSLVVTGFGPRLRGLSSDPKHAAAATIQQARKARSASSEAPPFMATSGLRAWHRATPDQLLSALAPSLRLPAAAALGQA